MIASPSTGPGTANAAAAVSSAGSDHHPPRRASHASGIAASTAAAADSGQINSDQPNSRECRHGALAIMFRHFAAENPRTSPASVCETTTPAL